MIGSKPGRPRRGSTYIRRDTGVRMIAISTWREGEPKPRFACECPANPDGSPMTEENARTAASDLQRRYDAGQWTPWKRHSTAPQGETVAAYIERWAKDREARGLRTVKDDRSRLAHYLVPTLGARGIADVTRDDLENIRDSLDEHVRESSIMWKTAENIWGVVSKLFRDASSAKLRALRVRADNPGAGIVPPDRGDPRAKAYAYPSEFLALVECPEIDVAFRRLCAVAVYTYMRASELAAIGWSDVDLDHMEIAVHEMLDGKTGERRKAKTAAGNRTVPIERELLPLLRAMRDECGGVGPLFPSFPAQRDAAKWLRAGLWIAGARREALHVSTPTRVAITFHDLRATGTTWCAVRGDEPVKLQRRAGHEDFSTTLGYIREAESRRAGFGVVFPPLPAALLIATQVATTSRHNGGSRMMLRTSVVPAAGVEPAGHQTTSDASRQTAIVSSVGRHASTANDVENSSSATGVADGPEIAEACGDPRWLRVVLDEVAGFYGDSRSEGT